MRVLKVFDGDYPWDVRVEKIVDSLRAAGHEVRLLCRNRRGDAGFERCANGLEIARLPALPGPLSLPLFFNPVWAIALAREVRRFRPDVLMVRDLPLAPLVVFAARRLHLPVVIDYAEPYPESLRSQRQFDRKSLLDRWLRNPAAAEVLERYVVRHAAAIWLPCDEAAERLVAQGLRDGQAVEVGNTPRLETFAAPTSHDPVLDIDRPGLDADFPIVFSGLLAGDRGLDVAIDALALLERRHPGTFSLVVVGEGPVRAALAAQAGARGLADRVHFTGFLEYRRLPAILRRARVGLLPFHRCPHIEHTLANKLFEYMSLGLPVVVSDVKPMLRVLEEVPAGVSFRAGDAESLASAIEDLAQDPGRLAAMATAGLDAARRRYNWSQEERRLLASMASLE